MANMKMPSLFLSHGSSILALEEEPTTLFLRNLSSQLPKPEAIIVASAHWETDHLMITGASYPETIHDFGGFPKELYEIQYPVPGNPKLSERIKSLLIESGFNAEIDPIRGLDHGVWDPLYVMYPNADIPVVEISVQPNQNAKYHYNIGQALASLKDENIFIIGSGNLTHNLREAFRGQHQKTPEWVSGFSEWVADRVKNNDISSLLNWKELAPYANQNHPTPEHFLPFFIALGVAGDNQYAKRLNTETAMGVLAMDAYIF